MITGFDHVVIGVRDLAAAITSYEVLLGARATAPVSRDGVATALIGAGNISIELMAPDGDGAMAKRLTATLQSDGEGLKSLVFATDDIEAAHRRCERVGLQPEEIATRATWCSFRLNTERTHGVRVFMLQRDAPLTESAAHVRGVDHVVIRSADMERVAALYGARLGLDLRLDREVGGRRFMFFRCGDAVLEIPHDRGAANDWLWGLAWRITDADDERARLAEAGLDVSDVRQGMKPGTRVFTVRSGACGVPTLMIESGKD